MKVVISRTVTSTSKKYKVKRTSSGYTKPSYAQWYNGYTKETKKNPIKGDSVKKSGKFEKDKKFTFNKKAKIVIQEYDKKSKKYTGKKETYNFYYCPKLKLWCIYKDLEGRVRLGDPSTEGNISSSKKKDEKKEESEDEDIEYIEKGTNVKKFINQMVQIEKKQGKADEEIEPSNNTNYGVTLGTNGKDNSDSNLNISDFDHLIRSKTIHYADRLLWNQKFNRMQYANPYFVTGPTREYLFFTKPDLHIMNNNNRNKLNTELCNDPFWIEMKDRYRRIISDLQYSARRNNNALDRHEFMPILTNSVSSSLDMPSSSADTIDTAANIYGTSIQYRKGSFKSDEGYDFSLEFIDNPYLDVYHLFKMWDYYEGMKSLGEVTPPGGRNSNPYRLAKILHDQIGIFKFIVADDMETILYYAYFTGCFPKSVPRETFNNLNPGLITYSVDWHAQFVEDNNPLILLHFNRIQKKYAGIASTMELLNSIGNKFKYAPLFNDRLEQLNGGWRDFPYISKVSVRGKQPVQTKYLLRWYDWINNPDKKTTN